VASRKRVWTWLGAGHENLYLRANVHSRPVRLVPVMGLFQAAQPLLEALMLPTWGYMALRSKDKKTMVQVFTDLSTGLIVYTQVCQRAQSWHSWGPPTEVERVD
jgi:hypothetical protein